MKNSQMAWKFDDDIVLPSTKKPDNKVDEEECSSKIRHWEKILDLVTEIQVSLKLLPYPTSGTTIVGGSVELEAGRISVACMNGDMTSNSWALFNVLNPSILFCPEAQFYYINKDDDIIGRVKLNR